MWSTSTPVTSRSGPPIAPPIPVRQTAGARASAVPLAGATTHRHRSGEGQSAQDAKIRRQNCAKPRSEDRAESPEPPARPGRRVAGAPPKSKRRASRPSSRPVAVELRRQGDSLRLFFPFAEQTPAAVFQRADTLWLVFDTAAPIDIGALSNDPSQTIRSADFPARTRRRSCGCGSNVRA